MSLQIFPFLWERETLLVYKTLALNREGEGERRKQAEEGEGENIKRKDAKYTHPFFGSSCASISCCVGLDERMLRQQQVPESLR